MSIRGKLAAQIKDLERRLASDKELGKTRSGKGIFAIPTHANTDIGSWSKADHEDAMRAHEKESDKHYGKNEFASTHHMTQARFHENAMKKTARETTIDEWKQALANDEAMLKKIQQDLHDLEAGKTVENLTIEGAKRAIQGLKGAIHNKKQWLVSQGVH